MSDRTEKQQDLAQALRNISVCQKNISNQLEVLAELRRDGHDTSGSVRLLRDLEELLALHVRDRDRLLKDLGG
jgi:arginine repressor